MKKINRAVLTTSLAVLIALPLLGADEASALDVRLSVQVVARTPLDTVNDFDFSTVNLIYETGKVAGVPTNAPVKNIKWCPAAV